MRSVELLQGTDAQDRAVELISSSESYEPIKVMAYIFDYQPLIAALCAAKLATPPRQVLILLDRGSTLTGPTKQQNAMARQLLLAVVKVRLARGRALTPVYQAAGRQGNFGSLVGILHAKRSWWAIMQ